MFRGVVNEMAHGSLPDTQWSYLAIDHNTATCGVPIGAGNGGDPVCRGIRAVSDMCDPSIMRAVKRRRVQI